MMWQSECGASTSSPSTPPPVSPQNQFLNHEAATLQPLLKFQGRNCFNCDEEGHWVRNCPYKTSNKSQLPGPGSTPNINYSDIPLIRCRCGGGACLILISNSTKNPGRKYYTCPVSSSSGRKCNFFEWCDEVSAPNCPCGAGACSINTQVSGPNARRKYYACRIKKGHGACPFFQWVDARVDTTMNAHVDESKCYGSHQTMCNSHRAFNTLNNDLGNTGYLSSEHLEMMEFESPVMNNPPHTPSAVVPMPSDEKDETGLIESSKHNEMLDISSMGHCDLLQVVPTDNDSSAPNSTAEDVVMQEADSWDPMMEKAHQVFRLTSHAEIQRRQTELWRQISAARNTSTGDIIHQILCLHVLGWWGRISFPPSRCLTDLPPRRFFRCVFPSFDPISVPRDRDVFDIKGSVFLKYSPSNAEPYKPSTQENGQEAQPLSVLREPLGFKSPPSKVVITDSISKAFGQAALCVRNDLLTALMSMNPCDNETMLQMATATFDALDRLSINCGPFSEHVREYISCASRLTQIEGAIGNSSASRELIERYNSEKDRFDDVACIHAEVMATCTASEKRLESLHDKASRVRDMLIEIESQLSRCEAETLELRTRMFELSKDVSESERRMQAASQEAEAAFELRRREEELCAAKAALERARIQLQQ